MLRKRNHKSPLPRCGKPTRAGTPCRLAAGQGTSHLGSGACHKHKGNDGPVKHGLYSRYAHTTLSDRIEELVADPKLTDLTQVIATQAALFAEHLEKSKRSAKAKAAAFEVSKALVTSIEKYHKITFGEKQVIRIESMKGVADEIVDDETQFPVNLNGCRLGYNAAVTWCAQSDSYKNWEVYYAKSSNLGQSWPIFERLSWGSSYSIQPTIDSNANQRVYVAWADNWSGEFKLLFTKSSNSGQSWSEPSTVPLPPFGSGVAWQPDIAWDRTTDYDAHLIWVGYEDVGRLYYNIYDGTDWDDPDTASVPPPDGSVFKPDFSIDDDGNMFVVWTDVTDSTSIVKWDQDPSN